MLQIKKGQNLFIIIQIFIDTLLIFISFYLTFWLRVNFNPYFTEKFLSLQMAKTFIPPLYFIIPLYILIFNKFGIYDLFKRRSSLDTLFLIIKGVFYVTLILIAIAFIFKEENYSRSLIFLSSLIVLLFMGLSHFFGRRIFSYLKEKKIGLERVVMIGTNIKALKMVSYIKKEPKLGFNFVGFLLSKANTNNPNQPKEVIGNLSDCEEIINKYKIDRFIIWDPTLSREELMNLTSICSRMDVELNMVPDLLSHFSRKIDITQINGYPIISLKRVEFDRWDIAVKRIFDLVIGSTSLILLFPFMVIIAILIKLDSKGPIFYIQERLGRGGRYFKLYKFRSMYEDADRLIPKEKRKEYADGYLFKILDDPRITKVGRFLRRYSIDELPQLINVLKGEMSLVGPRPLPVVDIKYLEESEDYRFWSIQRGNVLPGITGLWQVSGRSNLTFEEMAELDIYYVEEWSIWLDIKILLKTIPKVISGEGAY